MQNISATFGVRPILYGPCGRMVLFFTVKDFMPASRPDSANGSERPSGNFPKRPSLIRQFQSARAGEDPDRP
ncbi:hypothetical protein SAMN02745216_01359 [Desulfatibacillum alkenivorans DSM 16219]|uniref:Uncharacterized protein n=1 Tax=Desulfatibacillum alkenivorans DSM 16219 TaxID=1121393 RepID=A0A1M6I588_9BACT|nr:hypothetical protein SAMN02745216_01359 [Desulfatibacillum alkenivorans DSM 16219]